MKESVCVLENFGADPFFRKALSGLLRWERIRRGKCGLREAGQEGPAGPGETRVAETRLEVVGTAGTGWTRGNEYGRTKGT